MILIGIGDFLGVWSEMAVFRETNDGLILDHCLFLDRSVGKMVTFQSSFSAVFQCSFFILGPEYRFIAGDLFSFVTPFRMDLEAERIADGRPQKKKAKLQTQVASKLHGCFGRKIRISLFYFQSHAEPAFVRQLLPLLPPCEPVSEEDLRNNNSEARAKAKDILSHPLAAEMTSWKARVCLVYRSLLAMHRIILLMKFSFL